MGPQQINHSERANLAHIDDEFAAMSSDAAYQSETLKVSREMDALGSKGVDHQCHDGEPSTESRASSTGPKQISLSEWKKWKRLYVTVRHARVQTCRHTLDIDRDPRNNCAYCWFAYFNTHGELVQTVDEIFTQHGQQAVIQMRGEKFWKNFLRFMVTLNAMKQQAEATDATTGETTTSQSEQ